MSNFEDRVLDKLDRVAEDVSAIKAHREDTVRRITELSAKLDDHTRADERHFAALSTQVAARGSGPSPAFWKKLGAALAAATALAGGIMGGSYVAKQPTAIEAATE